MNDNSKMPFGKYKGKALANVPASYLLFLYEEGIAKGELRDYIQDNRDAIVKTMETTKK